MLRSREAPLSGTQKAAVVVAALPGELAGRLLSLLGGPEARAVGFEVARLSELPEDSAERTLREFLEACQTGGPVLREGVDRAKRLLREALPAREADAAVAGLEEAESRRPFAFLDSADAEAVLAELADEGPQTIALVLAHLAPGKAARVLGGLPARIQGEVVRRIARMRGASAEAVRTVEEALSRGFGAAGRPEAPVASPRAGGTEHAAEILRAAGSSVERSALGSIEDQEPELADEIRKRLFDFEDLLRADDRGIRALLKEVTTQELSVALKTASEDLRGKIFSNLSRRAGELLREEMEFMRPVRLSEVETAQARILDAARRLEESGDLFVAGRASGEDYVV
jgi:flagellar motor switch protein FliG